MTTELSVCKEVGMKKFWERLKYNASLVFFATIFYVYVLGILCLVCWGFVEIIKHFAK